MKYVFPVVARCSEHEGHSERVNRLSTVNLTFVSYLQKLPRVNMHLLCIFAAIKLCNMIGSKPHATSNQSKRAFSPIREQQK